ncbi:rubredoxin [Rapidithrix thailandica]|uniref:Rubredoxin n=1 Tax=Rapidithrix thailandica TaxID=413964 RepID=A0AAW9S687_9BACT
MKKQLVRVFVKGGALSPADLMKVLTTAEENFGCEYVHFGSRQDMIFPVTEYKKELLDETFQSIQTAYEYELQGEETYQNIVSSMMTVDMLPNTYWMHTDTYYYILEAFDYLPKLKINICDPQQSLVPLFTGQLNFVASEYDNYWYLYLGFPEYGQKLQVWPELVFSFDIAKLAKALEELYFTHLGLPVEELYAILKEVAPVNGKKTEEDLQIPDGRFPYYEGMNKMAGDKYWLGLYWRNNRFTISFLKDVCTLCDLTQLSKFYITPWKSFIVKGIMGKDCFQWEKLCGVNGINMRHSSLELNWHLPLMDEDALQLKRYLVKTFDQNDISTLGLSFTIKTRPLVVFTSVIIEKNPPSQYASAYELLPSYTISYAKDFNPNQREVNVFASSVVKEDLPPLLMELSKLYYQQLEKEQGTLPEKQREKETTYREVYQCGECLSVYDEEFGDPDGGIVPATVFADLPEDYQCALCQAPKASFEPSQINLAHVQDG